jgi:RNA polymerase sigma factor (sigma-70 family)
MTTTSFGGTHDKSPGRGSLCPEAADTPTLVADALQGDSAAWTELVHRYGRIPHAAARRFGLNREEHDDAVQRTWQRAVEHLSELRDAAALPGWLATAARHECLALLRARVREAPSGDMFDCETTSGPADVADVLISAEEARALRRAVEDLPSSQRALMRVFLESPVPSYAEISHRLSMPIGSIGPSRGRAMQRLAQALAPLRV